MADCYEYARKVLPGILSHGLIDRGDINIHKEMQIQASLQ